MVNDTHDQIARLQKYLRVLRKVAGLSAEELASMLDITRQSAVNLETGKIRMNKVYYLAIRVVLEERSQSMHNPLLSNLVTGLIDTDEYSDSELGEILDTIKMTTKKYGPRNGSMSVGIAISAALEKLDIIN